MALSSITNLDNVLPTAFVAPLALSIKTNPREGSLSQRQRSSHDLMSTDVPKTRLRARVAYVGTHYHGWQLQTNSRTIQGELEAALFKRFRKVVRVVGASRTDTGVHARGQGVHLDIPLSNDEARDSVQKLQFALNHMLPADVRIRALSVAPPPCIDMVRGVSDEPRAWHTIFRSRGKHYVYRFSTRAVHDPLQHGFRMHDIRAARNGFCTASVRAAAAHFTGTHDFTAFANSVNVTASGVRANPIRTLHRAELCEEEDGHFRIDFEVDGALYKMLRNVAGTLLAIGSGQMDVSDVPRLFDLRDRSLVPKSAPAQGLCLEKVFYDDWDT